MRLNLILVTLVLGAASLWAAPGSAQTVTLSGANTALTQVFKEIEQQTGYRFFWQGEDFSSVRISVDVKDADLQQALSQVFKGLPYSYTVSQKSIVVKATQRGDQYPGGAGRDAIDRVPTTGNALITALPTVSGHVYSEAGQPLAGASVIVLSPEGKRTSLQTTTNHQGVFTLQNVPDGAMLLITFMGYVSQEVPAKANIGLIRLKHSESPLDEVQVIAYGTTSRRLSTGNITTVRGEEIERQPISNPLLALAGRVPGLTVIQQSGIPGGGVTVRIQGENSIASGNNPLYVIDGVPYYSEMPLAGFENFVFNNPNGGKGVDANPNPLNFINPADIEQIDVLKDADATAIYGSRAANGAILITTKKGAAGKIKLNLNFQQGWGDVTRTMPMLNSRQYLDMRYEGFKNEGAAIPATAYDLTLWDTTRYTDWQQTLIGGTAQYTQTNATISGGSSAIQYRLGGTYQRETTVFPGDFANDRGTVHFQVNNTSANNKVRIQFSGSYQFNSNFLPGQDPTQNAYLLEPVAPEIYSTDGSLNWAPNATGTSTWTNPFVSLVYVKFRTNTNNLIGNANVSYKILSQLEISSSFGYTKTETNDYQPTPLFAIAPEWRITNNPNGQQRDAMYGQRDMFSWISEPQVTYRGMVGAGKLDALFGVTVQQSQASTSWLQAQGFGSDQVMQDIKYATAINVTASSFNQYKYSAVFARLNYNLWDKYIFSLNGRRDGSSRFGAENRFQNFGSVAGAWLFSEEDFLEFSNPLFSYGKVRASYGITGNDQIGNYRYLNLYNAVGGIGVPYQGTAALTAGGLSNPYLQWESTQKLQVGVDMGFIQDRVLISMNYGRNRSSNQLIVASLPLTTGFATITENFPAAVQNTSWEFSLASKNLSQEIFQWTTNINFTAPRNKVIRFPGIENTIYTNPLNGVIIGQPLRSQMVFDYLGVDPETGEYLFGGQDGIPTSEPTTADQTIMVNLQPKYYGGLQNTVQFKGFYLDFLFQFTKQLGMSYIFNNSTATGPGAFFSGTSNQPTSVLGRWQQVGDEVTIRRFSSNRIASMSPVGTASRSDANFTDASFIRLKTASLSYTFPTTWLRRTKVSEGRIYVQGQNLWTITNYLGPDPENQSVYALPPLRMFTVGIQANF